jgi:hypothetical protein
MAREFGLAASRGSDFHSPDESHTDLGTLPPARRPDAGVGTAGRPRIDCTVLGCQRLPGKRKQLLATL